MLKFEGFAMAPKATSGGHGFFFPDILNTNPVGMAMGTASACLPYSSDGLSLGLQQEMCSVGALERYSGEGGSRHGKEEEYETRSVIENLEGSGSGAGSGDEDHENNERHGHPYHHLNQLSNDPIPDNNNNNNTNINGKHLNSPIEDGDDDDNGPPSKKRYHRHLPNQIQELESFFKECAHPDEKMRQLLSKKLNLTPRQVKFWFQNRRTQSKAQDERVQNSILRQDNERLRVENITLREAIRNASCPACGGPTTIDMSMEDQQLRIENARLRDELERLYAAGGKSFGASRSFSSAMLPFGLPPPGGASELVMGNNNFPVGSVITHDLGHGLSISDPLPLPRLAIHNDMEKALIVDEAMSAMDEFLHLNQSGESMWMTSSDNHLIQVLDFNEYSIRFPKTAMSRSGNFRSEATRASAEVMMNGLSIVDAFLDVNRWMDMFPCIVTKAEAGEVISMGVNVTRNGALQMMNGEIQVLSPLVPTREIYFLRFCKLLQDNVWAIVDVSVDTHQRTNSYVNKCRRRPSGCLIQELPNGYSKVTWIEHWECEDQLPHPLYRPLVTSGMGFGALRWLTTMQRQCERLVSLMASNVGSSEPGVIPTLEGRRSMLKLAQRMTISFCTSVSASPMHSWTTLSGGKDEDEVRIMTRKSVDNISDTNGIVLSAATSIWLPISHQRLFQFLRNENLRKEWDALSMGVPMQEVMHIAKGEDPGNCVSLLQAHNSVPNNMLILQECCTDASGSLVVYAPVDVPNISAVMNGGDPSLVTILPSGFAILPNGLDSRPVNNENGVPEKPSVGGSLLTVAFQILVNTMPGSKFTLESINTVNSLVTNTVKQIRRALQ